MGKFTYVYLRQCANKQTRLGSWKNRPVYAVSAKEYYTTDDLVFIIYDDHNKVVINDICYGHLLENGDVKETGTCRYMKPAKPSASPVPEVLCPASGEYSEAVASHEFFSNLDAEINKLLKDSSSWEPSAL